YGVAFERNPNRGSFDFTLLERLVLVANERGHGAACVHAIFPGVWASTDNLGVKAVLAQRLEAVGLAGAPMIEQASGGDSLPKLDQATGQAAERGVFGAPTVFVGDEMFF